jgi:ankyrin repeat protein
MVLMRFFFSLSFTQSGFTPLHKAAQFSQKDVVKFLISKGVRFLFPRALGTSFSTDTSV